MKVRVGGVPEHFNLAWHLAIEKGLFASTGIDLDWVDVPGGTGAMCSALRKSELDIAIALTEGVVKDILDGNPSKIVQFYVNSPLRWGIFVNKNSPIQTIAQMQGQQYAISRYKSGSHLMAYVNAYQQQLEIGEDDFVLVGNLEGARKALQNDTAQLFLWEKYTTKPLVDSGEFRMIGECATPWPCFVIVVSNKFIHDHEKELIQILNIINLSCQLLKNDSTAAQLIANRYQISEQDAQSWFQELEYACSPQIDQASFNQLLFELKKFQLIDSVPDSSILCYNPHLVQIDN